MSTELNTAFEGVNLGHINKIRLIALSNLNFIPDAATGEISYNDLDFVSGTAFSEIYFTPETAYFNEQERSTRAGKTFAKELGFEIPKVRQEVISGLKDFENRKNAALVTDGNETSFLIFPLRILRKKQIPGQITSKNSISVFLTGESANESTVVTDVP
jgi:hypothetical protein